MGDDKERGNRILHSAVQDEVGRTVKEGDCWTLKFPFALFAPNSPGAQTVTLASKCLQMGVGEGPTLSSGSLCTISKAGSFQHWVPCVVAAHDGCVFTSRLDAQPAVFRVLVGEGSSSSFHLHLSTAGP